MRSLQGGEGRHADLWPPIPGPCPPGESRSHGAAEERSQGPLTRCGQGHTEGQWRRTQTSSRGPPRAGPAGQVEKANSRIQGGPCGRGAPARAVASQGKPGNPPPSPGRGARGRKPSPRLPPFGLPLVSTARRYRGASVHRAGPRGTEQAEKEGGGSAGARLKCRPADEERTAAGKTELVADP